jgi:hypothetical protein
MKDPFRDDVGVYLLGSLRDAERGAFETHLLDCEPCRAEVGELGHLPGLLALVPPEGASDPPPSVLEGLLEVVRRRETRRRTWLAGAGIAAATLVGVAASGEIVAMPWSGGAVMAEGTTVELRAVTESPVTASIELVGVPWGTRMDLSCSYADDRYAQPVEYALVVYDAAGRPEQVATWTALPGADASVPAATAIRLDQISRVEMVSGGAVVLVGEV